MARQKITVRVTRTKKKNTDELYLLIANRHLKSFFSYIDPKKSLTEYEKTAYCLAYSAVGNQVKYDEWLPKIKLGKMPKESTYLLLEAKIIDAARRNRPAKEVMKLVHTLLDRKPNAIFALNWLAQDEMIKGHQAKASKIVDQIKSSYPLAKWINRRLGLILLTQKRYKEALIYINQIPDPVQRIAYRVLAKVIFPFTKLVATFFLLLFLFLPETPLLWLCVTFGIVLAFLAAYSFFVKDEYLRLVALALLAFIWVFGFLFSFLHLIIDQGLLNASI